MMNTKLLVMAVWVAILTGGCQGLHFDGVLDVEPVIDPSDEGQPKESTNEDENSNTKV
jgi:hypothetical protein